MSEPVTLTSPAIFLQNMTVSTVFVRPYLIYSSQCDRNNQGLRTGKSNRNWREALSLRAIEALVVNVLNEFEIVSDFQLGRESLEINSDLTGGRRR
jgi:hypothetical protein